MTNTNQLPTAIKLAINYAEDNVQALQLFAMQTAITEEMLEEALDDMGVAYKKEDNKAIKADFFARSLSMDWDEYTSAVDETSAAVINNHTTTNIKGENQTMTTNTTTVSNTNTQGENNTMTNTTTVSNNNTNTKGVITMTNTTKTVFNQANMKEIQSASAKMATVLRGMGVHAPLFSQFVGDATAMVVDALYSQFVLTVPEAGAEKEVKVSFSTERGKQIIDFLMVVMPGLYPAFKEKEEFKALEKLNLKGRLTAKKKVKGKKTRQTVLMAALNMDDIYVVKNGEVLGKLRDFSEEELRQSVMMQVKVNGNEKWVPCKDITFYIAKDTNVTHLNSLHSLYQKMSGSLAAYRFAMALKKKVTEIKVVKEYAKNGMVTKIEEPQKTLILDEMCTFDGSGSLPFGEELNAGVLRAVFTEVHVVNKEDGVLEVGASVSEMESFTYKTYAKSMSQARSNGAVGFKTLEHVITYFLGTGQDERAYGETPKDENGKKMNTAYKVMDVAKSYKRFMLAGSNGLKADKGLLSTFSHNHKVEYIEAGEGKTFGEIKPAYIIITNTKGQKFTVALINEFEAQISTDQQFLLNVLDKNNALVGVEKFNHWNNADAINKLLQRNLTDGQGWHSSRVTKALRQAGVINSFDAFQLRVSNAVKGASFEFNPICELFGADMILTDGMVKSKDIVSDIKENGFQLFVVGQRKDSNDGVWIASQALQQMGLTVDELKQGVTNSIDFVKSAVENKLASDILTMLNASDEEEETEFAAVDYVRLSQEFGDVLDEQYIKDEIVSLAIKKVNKLLNAKLFTQQARTRYMFSDVFAIYNAAKAGRYQVLENDAVLKPYEVVAASKDENGVAFLEEGKALSVRFPVTVIHEIPVVKAVKSKEYAEFIEKGLWQGITFFDAFSWVVAQQAGADHDGDTSIIIFDPLMVNARLRQEEINFGGNEVLPFIDAYVKYDGAKVEFGTGAPTYETEATKNGKVISEVIQMNGFDVDGNSVFFNPEEFKGENGKARRREFLEVVAQLSQDITVSTIEASLIGIIANYAMILTDLLSRSVLTSKERAEVEEDLVILTTAGRWEIDRPKHGGAYLEMPLVEKLFAKFTDVSIDEAEMELTKEDKYAKLAEEKGVYRHIFGEVVSYSDNKPAVLTGFKVKKPQWLASQKDERGMKKADSTYEQVFGSVVGKEDNKSFTEVSIEALAEEFKVNHGNTTKNNIRGRVATHMEVTGDGMNILKQRASVLYNAYSQLESARSAHEKAFRENAEQELKANGVFGKKNLRSLTKAKKTAKIRNFFEDTLADYRNARELYKALLRKDMYVAARELGCDIRALVGAFYMVVNETKNNGKAAWSKDGREYRFSASNGFIALPFEVFAEEMSSLISGKITETYFVPQDLTFTLLQGSLTEMVTAGTVTADNAVRVRVMNTAFAKAGESVAINRNVRVAIKPEQQKDGNIRLVAYFLNAKAQVEDAMNATNEDAFLKGFAPEGSFIGVFAMGVSTVRFSETGTQAVVYLTK